MSDDQRNDKHPQPHFTVGLLFGAHMCRVYHPIYHSKSVQFHYDLERAHHPYRFHFGEVTRLSTLEECQTQYLALTRLYAGSTFERLQSGHHIFEFSYAINIAIVCKSVGLRDDIYCLPPALLPYFIEGFGACVKFEMV